MPKKKKIVPTAQSVYARDVVMKRMKVNFQDALQISFIESKEWTDKERAYYKESAKQQKNELRANGDATAAAAPVQYEQPKKHDEYTASENVFTSIKQNIPTGIKLKHQSFFVIGFQYQMGYEPDKDEEHERIIFKPVEMTILEFSLQHGIKRTFHHFIDPKEVTFGYRRQVNEHCETYHKIEPPYKDDIEDGRELVFERDYSFFWAKVDKFLKLINGEYPPLFCLTSTHENRKYLHMAQYAIDWLFDQSQPLGRSNPIKNLIPAELLFQHFYKNIDPTKDPLPAGLQELMCKSPFDYENGTLCSYHDDKGCLHCSEYICKKMVYAMFQAFTISYEFILSNKHVPRIRIIGSGGSGTQPHENTIGEATASTSSSFGRGCQVNNTAPSPGINPTVGLRQNQRYVDIEDHINGRQQINNDPSFDLNMRVDVHAHAATDAKKTQQSGLYDVRMPVARASAAVPTMSTPAPNSIADPPGSMVDYEEDETASVFSFATTRDAPRRPVSKPKMLEKNQAVGRAKFLNKK